MTEPATPGAKCRAALNDDLMVCERCALEWPAGSAAPRCAPITFDTLRTRMLSEVASAEASLAMVRDLKRDGKAADPAPARRRLGEIGAVLRLVEGVMADSVIKERLNGKK